MDLLQTPKSRKCHPLHSIRNHHQWSCSIQCLSPRKQLSLKILKIPVIIGNCQLFIQQKICQLNYPNEVGELKMVYRIDFSYTEMVSQKYGYKLLPGSAWDWTFFLAEVYTSGTTEPLLGGKYVKFTRYTYHLTLALPYVFMRQVFNDYC